jgi:trehalose 6-phosphate phosphatase
MPVSDLAPSLRPLTQDPGRAAIFCDVDGTLAPIVEHPSQARVPAQVAERLRDLAQRYARVACVSGRQAVDARGLVGVDGIDYVGLHGAEILRAGEERPRLTPAVAEWQGRVHDFAATCDNPTLRALRIRVEDKGPIVAFHWRDVPDEDGAHEFLRTLAHRAGEAGFATHWGRKVLEIRPPVEISKARAVRDMVLETRPRVALYGGDDATDLDAFAALDALVAEGHLDEAVRVGVRSAEGPRKIVDRADLVVDGVDGFAQVLEHLVAERS